MTESKQKLIHFKERIVYELSLSLGLDPDSLSSIELPDFNDPLYNTYVVLKENFNILTTMKAE
jgi:hypothetical protein